MKMLLIVSTAMVVLYLISDWFDAWFDRWCHGYEDHEDHEDGDGTNPPPSGENDDPDEGGA